MRNARGQFGKGNQAAASRAISKAQRPPGSTGVTAFAGFVSSGESNGALTGQQKWTTYANATNKPIIATGLRYFVNLIAGTDWHAEEPEGCSARDARRAMEIVEQGLLGAPMLKPWSAVVRKAAMYRPLGFSLHATSMRRRGDGMIVFSAIEHRPQFTIERWLRPDEFSPFDTAVQRTRETQKLVEIPLDECFYCVDDTFTDSPDGLGILRHVIEYVRRLDLFEGWELKAFSEDLGGIPYSKAPLGELSAASGTEDADAIQTSLNAATQVIRDFMNKRNKTPEVAQWLMQDSADYTNPDGTHTGTPKWSFDLIKTETANMAQAHETMRRIELQIARVLGIEFAIMGGDGGGSYSMHEDKTTTFETTIETTLTEMSWFATHQLARRLIAANGLDPDTCTPRIVAEPVSTDAILSVCQSLSQLSLAGLAPDDPAWGVMRNRMRLPPRPEPIAELMAPRLRMPPPPAPTDAADGQDETGADGEQPVDEGATP